MRFLVRFYLALVAALAATLALLFALTPYGPFAARVAVPNFGLYDGVVTLALTPARYHALRLGLGAVALAAGLAWAALRRPTAFKAPSPAAAARAGTGPGIGRLAQALRRPWQRLRPAQRGLAAGLLLAAAGVRLYYAAYYPLSLDELASYDYAVLPGPAVTASYYLFPNNHIFPNLLVGLVHAGLPGAAPRLALRLLPTLLSLLSLPLVYALSVRALRFGVATLGLGLYWLSPLAAYYAVAGRGYAWTLAAALAGLFAALELLRPGVRRPGRQLAWGVFGLSGVLGLYAVPTHLYALLGLGLGLLVGFGRQAPRRRGPLLGQLPVATLGIAVGAAVLYAPVGAVSGWPALLANRYVARHEWAEFRLGIGPFLLTTASELLGQRGLSALAYAGVLALAPWALRRGQQPAPARRLGWLLYAQLGLWLPLAVAQHVYPPARTLLLVLLAFFLLLALAAALVAGRWLGPRVGPWVQVLLLGGGLVAYGGYRLHREQAVIGQQTRQQELLQRAYGWLRTQPVRRIWVEARPYAITWEHYALRAGQRPLPVVVLDDVPAGQLGAAGDVLVLTAPAARATGRPVLYQEGPLRIVPVAAGQAVASPQ